jgi:hypothetical protein
MKTWKIVLFAVLATLAIGLVAASAYATVIQPASTPSGISNGISCPYGYAGGMMRGGMMGGGYSSYNGYGGCMGAWGWP